jgi:hypothetical protein
LRPYSQQVYPLPAGERQISHNEAMLIGFAILQRDETVMPASPRGIRCRTGASLWPAKITILVWFFVGQSNSDRFVCAASHFDLRRNGRNSSLKGADTGKGQRQIC